MLLSAPAGRPLPNASAAAAAAAAAALPSAPLPQACTRAVLCCFKGTDLLGALPALPCLLQLAIENIGVHLEEPFRWGAARPSWLCCAPVPHSFCSIPCAALLLQAPLVAAAATLTVTHLFLAPPIPRRLAWQGAAPESDDCRHHARPARYGGCPAQRSAPGSLCRRCWRTPRRGAPGAGPAAQEPRRLQPASVARAVAVQPWRRGRLGGRRGSQGASRGATAGGAGFCGSGGASRARRAGG